MEEIDCQFSMQILFEDDKRPKDAPDLEADALHPIAVYAGVGGDREIAEVKEETWSEDMSDGDVGYEDMGDEDMSDEEEVGDKEPMVEVEQKVGDKEESEAQNVDAKETAVER
ncbi:hypothetical protein AA0112_g1284 [Alternaria arborescens]|nr:hypothetical protein AA0112_g1284 [Alternaria arborescens]